MKTATLLRRWTAVMLAVVLSICIFAIPAFAEETTDGSTTEEITTDGTTTDDSTTGESTTDGNTTEATTTDDGHDHENETTTAAPDKDDKKLSTPDLVGFIVLGVLVVAAIVLGIRFREKVGKFLRVYKSEGKKIVWLPWDQTKKSTLVVIIVLIAAAVAICLLDFVLGQGIMEFIKLFK